MFGKPVGYKAEHKLQHDYRYDKHDTENEIVPVALNRAVNEFFHSERERHRKNGKKGVCKNKAHDFAVLTFGIFKKPRQRAAFFTLFLFVHNVSILT